MHIIHIFTPDGTHTTWGYPGQFTDPIIITIDEIGNLYVGDLKCYYWGCDPGNYQIRKFSPDRQYIASLESVDNLPFRPRGIALDSNGNVYVTDDTEERIRCDINNSNCNEFRCDDRSTDFCNVRHHRIQKFTPNPGGTVYTPDIPWETWGNSERFSYPSGIAVDRDLAGTAYVYVADTRNNYIHKFTLNGDYITTWTEAAPNDAFNWPWGLATDENGNVYVADSENYRCLEIYL